MPKKGEYVRFNERKIKLPFLILKLFQKQEMMESKIWVSLTNNYQKHVVFSYGYKLVCVDDQFSKPYKSNLDEDTVYSFV